MLKLNTYQDKTKDKNMKKNLIYFLIAIFLLSALFIWFKKDSGRLFSPEKSPVANNEESEKQKENSLENFISEEDLSFHSGFNNEQLAYALESYFLERFSWKTQEGSWRRCTVKNLEPENKLFPFSVWVYCVEYLIEDNQWQELSGFSGPVKVNYPDELSFYDISRFSHLAPRDGSYYAEDIKNIFSEEAQNNLTQVDVSTMEKINRQLVYKNHLAWENMKDAIRKCQVEQVFQAHSLQVEATLKDGTKIRAIEPKIDEIMHLVTESKCIEQVKMATE